MRITKTEDPTTTHTQTHGERVTQEKKTKIKKVKEPGERMMHELNVCLRV